MKILIVLPRVPYPLEKGDKLRAFHQIKHLSKNNEIHLVALNETEIHPKAIEILSSYCDTINILNLSKISIFFNLIKAFFNGKPLQVGFYYNAKIQKKINKLVEDISPDRIYCQLIRTTEYLKNSNIYKTLDFQDVFSKGVQRRINSAPFYLKPLLKIEYYRLLKYERHIFDFFNEKIIISDNDRQLIPHPNRNLIHIIPNGVDTSHFKPLNNTKEFDIVFTGNMNYPPNINSAEYIVKQIMPLVWNKIPNTKVLLAGANPSIKVMSLQSSNVFVTGWVEDIRESYAQSKIFVAPMQIGTGLQNKLLEAMAMQMPCITSDLANGPLGAENKKEIIVCQKPEEYANEVINLLENKSYADNIALYGFKFVQKNYDWETYVEKLEKIIIGNP